MGEGSQRQEAGTGATVEGVRAEARAKHEAAGSDPGNAPAGHAPRPKTELRRVTVCEHDERLEVKSVRGIGFSWHCTCGAHGVRWRKRVDAVAEKHEHEREHRR